MTGKLDLRNSVHLSWQITDDIIHANDLAFLFFFIDAVGLQKSLPFTEQGMVITEHLNITDEGGMAACACDQ